MRTVIIFVLLSCFCVAAAQEATPQPKSYFVCSEKHPPSAGPCATGPRPVFAPDPEYSPEARQARLQGTVVIDAVVGTDGRTSDIRVTKALGKGLDEEAVKALRQWKFEPGTINAQPVPVQVTIEMRFRTSVNIRRHR